MESGNSADCYTVATMKDGKVVVHVPRNPTRVCALFLQENGVILCIIAGSRRRSQCLPLEELWNYHVH